MKKFENILSAIIEFRDRRNWKQFHKIKDLLVGLNIEVGELMELFLWKNDNQIEEELEKDGLKTRIGEELSDIFIFIIYLSDHFKIDLLDAVQRKLLKNNEKYPVEKAFNSNKKYTQF